MSPTIVFFGNERLATGVTSSLPVLRALLGAGYKVAAVVVAQNESGASRSQRQLEVQQLAAEHNLPLMAPARLSEATAELAALGADAAVLVAYGKIVPQSVIDVFPGGIINLHPSLLPKHRGPTPIESAMLAGGAETGVSLMSLSAAMDAGAVYAQQVVRLSGTETKQALADRLDTLGADLLLKHLSSILDGSLAAAPQDDTQASYDQKINHASGVLDWQKPAAQLEREVRAYAGWPRSRATIGNTEVVVTAAHAASGDGQPGSLWLEAKQLGVHTVDGLLIIDQLIPAGKKEMPAADFLAGYHPN